MTRRLVSIYLRSAAGSCLVKVTDTGISSVNNELAKDKAQEMGIYPAGTVLAYSVVEQDDYFYDKLITAEEAKEIVSNGKPAIR